MIVWQNSLEVLERVSCEVSYITDMLNSSMYLGLSAATLDKQYQSQRRMRQFRNKPKHALYGVTAGATSLVTSVASGFQGLAVSILVPRVVSGY